MNDKNSLSRRGFLYGSALVAGSAALAACSSGGGNKNNGGGGGGGNNGGGGGGGNNGGGGGGNPNGRGSASKPLPKPSSFQESPTLKGKGLPSVEQRLPDNPYVIPHKWVTRGKYGGNLNMDIYATHGMAQANWVGEFFYGHTPARYLNDGMDIGPGIAETWSANADASEWTINFRKGLKWSDGKPWTVDDVLFWYEDMALPGHDALSPPPDLLSAKGNPAKMTKVDDTTLKITYDSPQPLLPDYMSAWVKGNIGGTYGNGPAPWMFVKHYLKQFHPKYNPKVKAGWDSPGGLWETKADWRRNPDCPTLTGWRCKSFNNNTGSVFERNPYYYVVTPDGDQLPYIDTITWTAVQNAQSILLDIQQGKVDYCHGPSCNILLAQVSTLSKTKSKGHYDILTWDSGSGTGAMFFFNRDYQDPKYQKLFRDKRFIRALSLSIDRKSINHSLYFDTGELTTGTMSPKAIEFHTNPNGPKTYQEWRDSWKERDVAKGKALLAEMGLKDKNGDGYVEFPDGSKLTIDYPYSADVSDTEAAFEDQVVANAKDIGLRLKRRPIPPAAYPDAWNNGTYMVHGNWEIGDGPNCLVYPQWLAPLENTRWAPLEGAWYQYSGTPKIHQELSVNPWKRHPPRMPPEKGGPTAKLVSLYNQTKVEPDQLKRTKLVWDIMKVHMDDGPFFFGCAANYLQVVTANTDLKNVPGRDNLMQHGFVNPWVVPAPAVYDPEVYYWDNPTQHT